MNNKLRPYAPTHPGDVLKDELQARGISQNDSLKLYLCHTRCSLYHPDEKVGDF